MSHLQFWLCGQTKSQKTEFTVAMKAVLKHHFNNHYFCNPSLCHFCKDSVRKSDDSVRAKLKNMNIPANKVMYDEVKQIHNACTTQENLLMLMHPYNSQKNKALNHAFLNQHQRALYFPKHFLFLIVYHLSSSLIQLAMKLV